jgi:hypothetical protein
MERQTVGQTFKPEPCGSWISPGVDAAFCAAGQEAPAASGDTGVGQIEFTGAPRGGAEGGIAQAVGILPEGRSIGIKVDSTTEGTLIAQGICDRTLVRATFSKIRFRLGDTAQLGMTLVGGTPVIMVTHNGRKVAPDREVLVDLTWLPANSPSGCAFRVA